jgi:uncharacterized protein (TIGR02466 family)
MFKNKYTFLYSGPLLYKSSLEKKDRLALMDICNKNKKIKFNASLAGAIKDEYKIEDLKSVKLILDKYMLNFVEAYHHWYDYRPKSIEFKTAWTNFMKANEYNPPHIHKNSHFSSVFYLNVPKQILEERKKIVSNGTKPGDIGFLLSNSVPFYIAEHTSSPKTDDFFIFPASLPHFVNPFKSKVTRVSMAINFNIL